MGPLLFCLSGLLLWTTIQAQTCPSEVGWVMYNKKCYKFNAYPRLELQKASTSCQYNGATLVSVNTIPEHQFIAEWLLQNDNARSSWLTSGVYTNQGIRWEGDGVVTTSFDKWINSTQQRVEGQRIIYAYQGTEFGWTIATQDVPYCYICEISIDEVYKITQEARDFDYGLNVENPSRAPRGPVFLQEPADTVILGTTTSVILECLANGNPEPTYEWLIDNFGKMVPLVPGPRISFTTGKLEIRNPVVTDENTYQCKATNANGTVLSSSASLSFGSLGEFSNVAPAPVYGYEYDGAQLECPGISAKPGKTFMWYKNNFEVIRPQAQAHTFISATGKLLFSEVAQSDEGVYACIVTLTSFGQDGNYVGAAQAESRNSLGFPLVVRSGGASEFQPKIQNDFIFVYPPTPTRQGTVSLECFAYGTGPLEYSWYRGNSKPLPTGHRFDSNKRILILYNVKLEDGGPYFCSVYSTKTKISDNRTIDLVIQSKPYFTYPLTHQHVDVGSRLTWHCEAFGQPMPTYQWYKNGVRLQSSTRVSITVNTLTIDAVDVKGDSGMYQCAATNQHGSTLSTGQLRVLQFAPSFLKHPMKKMQSVALGGQVTIICDPEAAPMPMYTWKKDGNELTLVPGQYEAGDHYKLLINGNLIVQNIVASDQGRYTCHVKNMEGEAEDYSDIKIVERLTMTQIPNDQKVEVNHTATLFCEASPQSVMDIMYLWKFNDHIIDYNRQTEYKLSNKQNPGFLYITPTQYKHEGRYTCIVTTGKDFVNASAFVTVIGPPGEPAGVFISDKPYMANDVNNPNNLTDPNLFRWVVWTDGMDRGSIITHYFVQQWTDLDQTWTMHPDGVNVPVQQVTNEQYPTKRFIRLANLKAGVGVKFRVMARNGFGIGAPSLPTALTQIPGTKPMTTVKNIRGGGGSVGELSIVWDPLPRDNFNAPKLSYKVFWRTYEAMIQGDASKWRTVEVNHDDVCKVKVDYINLRGQAFLCNYVVLVGPLFYYSPYAIKIQTFNQYGVGPTTNETTIMSAEEMPMTAPENVKGKTFNSTALMITWKPVTNDRTNMRGKLKGYRINYWRKGMDVETQALQNIIELKKNETNLAQGLIIGLEPMMWYDFNVQAYNSAGNGPKSSTYNKQTINKALSLYPTEVYVYSIEGFGVRVTFRGVSTQPREEPLRGYKVQYWKSRENILSAKEVDFGKFSTGVIRNLSSSELYELRVYGYSRGGQGKRSSPTVYFTVGDGQIQIDTQTTEILGGAQSVIPAAFTLVVIALALSFVSIL